jgi:hypothetical protein
MFGIFEIGALENRIKFKMGWNPLSAGEHCSNTVASGHCAHRRHRPLWSPRAFSTLWPQCRDIVSCLLTATSSPHSALHTPLHPVRSNATAAPS